MHFHGQMSTQPSHMMHSDWSMWMNCLGLTAFCNSSGETSWRTYSPGNDGRGGLASVFAISPPSGPRHNRSAEHRPALDGAFGRRTTTALLELHPEGHVQAEHQNVDAGGDDVAQRLVGHDDSAAPADCHRRLAELDAVTGD